MNALPFLPYGRQTIDDDDIAAVVDTLRSDFLTTGPKVGEFEKALGEVMGAQEVVVCANGTAALHLAYAGLGLGEGDAIVVPAITFAATANAARHANAEVVFADVDPNTGLMTAETLEAAIKRAKMPVEAVAPVHFAGQPADMTAIAEVATRHGLRIIEDACHALGSRFGGQNRAEYDVGDCAFSDATCFSFHPVKNIAMGEGGAVSTNDPAFAKRMRQLRHHGMTTEMSTFSHPEHGLDPRGEVNPWYAEMSEVGYNYRATDFQCALGLSQLKKLPDFGKRRRALFSLYEDLLRPYAPHIRMLGRVENADPCWHIAVALIDFHRLGLDRAAVMKALKALGIGTQVHYFPVSHQPYYRRRYGLPHLPGAWKYYEQCLSLPLFPAMQAEDVERCCGALTGVLGLKERAA